MATNRKGFTKRRGTVAIPNETVYDERLSFDALGILSFLLARPDSAPSGYRELMGRGIGKDRALRALRELSEAGYRHQRTVSFGRGNMHTATVNSPVPLTPAEASPLLDEHLLRAAETRARSDLGKHSVSAGRIVRGFRDSDRSDSVNPPHTYGPRSTSLRSVDQEDPSAHAHTRESEPAGGPPPRPLSELVAEADAERAAQAGPAENVRAVS